jgi:hypothetical protein
MHCRDRRAFSQAVLILCIAIVGCGGGSSSTTTGPLTATTTSLPGGKVNTPYFVSLTATGGTPPYTWSQSTGGTMPPGITLSSAGNFVGTPTTAGNYGPYVFKVTDNATDTSVTGSLSITISSSDLVVTTSSLPNGTVGVAYSFTLAATGGTPPYNWAERSGPALPPGIATLTAAGLIAGTPTAPGTYGPYVFAATDASNATVASASLNITIVGSGPAVVCTPQGNEGALTSATPYAFLLKGTDSSGNPIDMLGSFVPNGQGGITSATIDYNGFSTGPQSMIANLFGSSYSFGSSNQGCLYLDIPTSAIGSVQFVFGLGGSQGGVYQNGRIIESDNTTGTGTNASGIIYVQTPSAFLLSSLQPNFAFGLDGWTSGSSGILRTGLAGTFTNGSGTLSNGYADLITGGTPTAELTGGTGTLTGAINTTTGRGSGNLFLSTPTGPVAFNFVYYVLNGSDFLLLSSSIPKSNATTPLLAGRALASNTAYAAGTLNGYYLLASQGFVSGSPSANLAQIGTMNATSAGTIPTATIYSRAPTPPLPIRTARIRWKPLRAASRSPVSPPRRRSFI